MTEKAKRAFITIEDELTRYPCSKKLLNAIETFYDEYAYQTVGTVDIDTITRELTNRECNFKRIDISRNNCRYTLKAQKIYDEIHHIIENNLD